MKTTPRVLHVVLTLAPGGTERLVIDLCRRAPAGTAAVCCLDAAGPWAPSLEAAGVRVTSLKRAPGFQPGVSRQIARAAREHGAAVLHCHHYSPFVYGRLAALQMRSCGVVFTEHGRLGDTPPSPKRRIANSVLARLRGEFFAVSEDLRRHMLAEGFPARRTGVVHNGVAMVPAPSSTDGLAARHRLGIAPGRFVVGTVARLDPVKDLRTLIDGVQLLRRDVPSALLVIVGEGPERPHLEAACRDAALDTQVLFTGARDDARALLPAFDVFVNTSLTEGVSLTILEAMAAARPIVATRVGGTPEVLDANAGVMIPPGATVALAELLAVLAASPDRAFALGQGARRRFEERFTIDRMARQYEAAYLRVQERN